MFLKAQYGLKSSGKRWAEVIHSMLMDMKFLPSKADPCNWLRKAPNLKCYEYYQKKIHSGHNKVTQSHNVGTRLFSGFLVSSASGVVEWNC